MSFFNPIHFDLIPPPLVEDPKGSTDPVTIYKENVEQGILDIPAPQGGVLSPLVLRVSVLLKKGKGVTL